MPGTNFSDTSRTLLARVIEVFVEAGIGFPRRREREEKMGLERKIGVAVRPSGNPATPRLMPVPQGSIYPVAGEPFVIERVADLRVGGACAFLPDSWGGGRRLRAAVP